MVIQKVVEDMIEGLLILLNKIEPSPRYKDLVKKVLNIISGKRYAIVRQIIEGKDLEFIKEFLLLASKCSSFGDHDLKILRSLAEVVQPSLIKIKKSRNDINIVWTTEEGLMKTQDRIKHIGTIEIVDNAKEIEVARSYGDLRENSEYKFALERRSRLQGELKMLSDQLKQARVITKVDIQADEVGVGSIVELKDSKGNMLTYTILGPWDANTDSNVLSFQSKLAQAMIGNKKGDTFQFREEEYTVLNISSFL